MSRTSTHHANDAAEAVSVGEACRNVAADYYQRGRQKAQDAVEYTQGVVKERPLQAVMIAAGVGFLLGALWSWKRS